MTPYVRHMIRRDMPLVMEIERQSFDCPWTEDELTGVLRWRHCVAMVAEVGGQVAGFMVYVLSKNRIRVLDFAVAPGFRRRGVGRAMIAVLEAKLNAHRRVQIELEVADWNLDAQLFFRELGFRAEEILRGHFDGCDDAYRMVLSHRVLEEVVA